MIDIIYPRLQKWRPACVYAQNATTYNGSYKKRAGQMKFPSGIKPNIASQTLNKKWRFDLIVCQKRILDHWSAMIECPHLPSTFHLPSLRIHISSLRQLCTAPTHISLSSPQLLLLPLLFLAFNSLFSFIYSILFILLLCFFFVLFFCFCFFFYYFPCCIYISFFADRPIAVTAFIYTSPWVEFSTYYLVPPLLSPSLFLSSLCYFLFYHFILFWTLPSHHHHHHHPASYKVFSFCDAPSDIFFLLLHFLVIFTFLLLVLLSNCISAIYTYLPTGLSLS